MVESFSDEALAYTLALDVCDRWKLANGYKTLSADDLKAVKVWVSTSRGLISKSPYMQELAVRGIDGLMARQHQLKSEGGVLKLIHA